MAEVKGSGWCCMPLLPPVSSFFSFFFFFFRGPFSRGPLSRTRASECPDRSPSPLFFFLPLPPSFSLFLSLSLYIYSTFNRARTRGRIRRRREREVAVMVNGEGTRKERIGGTRRGEKRGDENRARGANAEALTMDLFGREAPKLPDYSITRRGQANGGSGRRGRR